MGRKRIKKEVVEDNHNHEEETNTAIRTKTDNKKLKSSAKFKCSECKDDFETENEANKHILKEHYGLARINDDSKTPFTENETLKALIKAQKTLKVLKCKINGCDKSFRSGLGLKQHWQMCGKSEIENSFECQTCGKQLKKSSMAIHMRNHAMKERASAPDPGDSETEVEEETVEDNSGKTSRRRASALRAQRTIRKATKEELITAEVISDQEFKTGSDSEATEEEERNVTEDERDILPTEVTNIPQKPNVEHIFKSVLKLWSDSVVSANNFLRPVPKGSLEKWKKEISGHGKVKCPFYQDCKQKFGTTPGMKYHYQRCGIDLKFLWKCKICGFVAHKGNRIIVQHLWNEHKESLPEIGREDSQCIQTANVALDGKGGHRTPVPHGIIDSVLEFHKRFYQKKSFPNLLPIISSWVPLKEDDFSTYIPDSNPSVNFKSTLSDNSWIRLNLFESIATGKVFNFFVGGPVWATAWCPIPLNYENRDQFVAVASNMNPNINHTFNDTDIEGGLIQLWNVGPLGQEIDGSLKPKMAFSISHFCGMIWDMEWCPGGTAWDDINTCDSKNSEILCRLGLLALACGDGFIRIHSIPYPETLPNSYQNCLYYNEPNIILNPPGVGNSVNCENTICKCLSWIRSNEQNLIVGGYGSGLIAVWDIITKSSLLIVEQNPSQLILRPLNSWIGHCAAVNRIKWIHNTSDQFLVSISLDRSAKLWNLKDLSAPINVCKRGLLTALDTHPLWNGMFLAGDECYQNFQNVSIFKDFGFFNYGAISLTTHKSCVWDLSVSEWTSAVASVDAAGEAVVFRNFQFKSDLKLKTYDRIPLYHISPSLLENSTSKTSAKSKAGRKSTKNSSDSGIDPELPPLRTYSEFSAKYGLIFNDYDLTNLKGIPIDEINRIRLPTPMQYQRLNDYPLLSINRVCWNPNFSSCAWILSATQSGLCRLTYVSFLTPN